MTIIKLSENLLLIIYILLSLIFLQCPIFGRFLYLIALSQIRKYYPFYNILVKPGATD